MATKRRLLSTICPSSPERSRSPCLRKSPFELTTSIEDINNIYCFKGKALGEGHFGIVRKARLKSCCSKVYAVKTMDYTKDDNNLNLIKRELSILRKITHPNIIQFYECYKGPKNYHFVMEYCSGDTLLDLIIQKGSLTEKRSKILFMDMLSAVNSLHHRGICHRDIKPDNFIFKKDSSQIKMIDFGLSKRFSKDSMKTMVGT